MGTKRCHGRISRMPTGARVSAAVALGFGAIMVSSSALAQPLPVAQPAAVEPPPAVISAPSTQRVVLTLMGREPGLLFSLYTPDAATLVAMCTGSCRMELPAGAYRIRVAGSPDSDVHPGSKLVEVIQDTTFEVDPAHRFRRKSGLAMGVTGTALLPVGYTVFMLGLFAETFDQICLEESGCEETDSDPLNAGMWLGIGMIVTGAVLTPVGWVRFARNRQPKFHEVRVTNQNAGQLSGFWLGPGRIGGGYGLGAGFKF